MEFSDHIQTPASETAVATINRLLKHTGNCPDNVTHVENTHVNEMDSQVIGLCPFHLIISYHPEKEPRMIAEAKCTHCNKHRCSKRPFAYCTESKGNITVNDNNTTRIEKRNISKGCFCQTITSSPGRESKKPYPRR